MSALATRHDACALLYRDDAILLGLRSPHRRSDPNCWDMIGGRVEDGETIEAALARELREELGVTPVEWVKIGVVDVPARASGVPSVLHIFAVTRWEGEPAISNHEHTRIAWFGIEEACALDGLASVEYRAFFRRVPALVSAASR